MKVDKSKTGAVRVGSLDFGDCFLDISGDCYIVVEACFDADDEFFIVETRSGKPVDGYTLTVNLETGEGQAFHNDELITPVHMIAKISED